MVSGSGFPKTARLLRRVDFVETRDQGRNFAEGPLAASFRGREASPTRPAGSASAAVARVGITVSSRVGGAVVRNRIKRRLREAFRIHRSELTGNWDIVINPRRPAVDAPYAEVEGALMKVISRLQSQHRPQ